MKIVRSLAILLVFWSLLAIAVTAHSQPGAIIAGEYKGVLESSGEGVLWDIHQLIVTQVGIDMDFQVMPMRRARHEFYSGRWQGLFAIFAGVDRPVPVVYSAPFATVKRYIFTAPGTQKLNHLNQLAGKKLGLVLGHVYSRLDQDLLRLQGTEVQVSPTQLTNVRMLISGRLDAILGNAYGIGELLSGAELPLLEYDLGSPVTEYEFAYAFHDTPKGRLLAERFSAAIKQLNQSGELSVLAKQFEQGINTTAKSSPE